MTTPTSERRWTESDATTNAAAEQWPSWMISPEADQGELVQSLGSFSTSGWGADE